MLEPIIVQEKPRDHQMKREIDWFRIITGIDTNSYKTERKGRLFGPRDKNFPV